MSHEDFDIGSLATYLRLTKEQVSRLAERGKLPGRRVSGQWRFPQAEVHHWWEERIGTSCESELMQVELILRRDEPDALVTDLVPIEAIAVPLAAKTRNAAIRAMVNLATDTGHLWDPDKLEDAVRARESLHPTALDNGAALLHPRRPMTNILAEPFVALGITPQGIPFGGSRRLTDIFFLICSTDDRGHLQTLARLSRLVAYEDFLTRLRAAVNPREVVTLLQEYEAKLPG